MSVEAAPILPPQQTYADITDQLARIPLQFPTRRRWLIATLCVAAAAAAVVLSLVYEKEHFIYHQFERCRWSNPCGLAQWG